MLPCLLEAHELHELQVPDLQMAVEGKLYFYWIQIVDGGIPDDAAETVWHRISPELRRRFVGEGRIVIHCKGALGLSGTLAARLLVKFGALPDEAIRQVRTARPGAIENKLQENYIKGCSKH